MCALNQQLQMQKTVNQDSLGNINVTGSRFKKMKCIPYNRIMKIFFFHLTSLFTYNQEFKHILLQIMEYLFKTNIDINAKNSKGQIAKSVLEQSKPQRDSRTRLHQQKKRWLTRKRESIMLVAVLIATMAFQAGVTPPGGVWQDDFTHHDNGTLIVDKPHKAGEAVMAHNHPQAFKSFMRANTVAFVSSLSTILLLISGLPFRRPLFMWILMMIMWLTVTSIAVTYAISIAVVTPKNNRGSLSSVIGISLAVWCGVMGILLIGNTVRLIDRWLKNKGFVMWRPNMCRQETA